MENNSKELELKRLQSRAFLAEADNLWKQDGLNCALLLEEFVRLREEIHNEVATESSLKNLVIAKYDLAMACEWYGSEKTALTHIESAYQLGKESFSNEDQTFLSIQKMYERLKKYTPKSKSYPPLLSQTLRLLNNVRVNSLVIIEIKKKLGKSDCNFSESDVRQLLSQVEKDFAEAQKNTKKLTSSQHNISELIQKAEELYQNALNFRVPIQPSTASGKTTRTYKKPKPFSKSNPKPKEYVPKEILFKDEDLSITSFFVLHTIVLAFLLRLLMLHDFTPRLITLLSTIGAISWFSGLIFAFSKNQIAKPYSIASTVIAVCVTLLYPSGIEIRLLGRLLVAVAAVAPFAFGWWLSQTWALMEKYILLTIALVSAMSITIIVNGLNLSLWWNYELSIAMLCLTYAWFLLQDIGDNAIFYPVAVLILHYIILGMSWIYYLDLLIAGVIVQILSYTELSRFTKVTIGFLLVWGATSGINFCFSIS